MKKLTSKQIEHIFRVMDLDTEEKRQRFLKMAEAAEPRPKDASRQLFVRTTGTTTEQHEADDAQLA